MQKQKREKDFSHPFSFVFILNVLCIFMSVNEWREKKRESYCTPPPYKYPKSVQYMEVDENMIQTKLNCLLTFHL
jgi:hypothetical protein